ncbi:MAG: cobalamin biosynthesis protein P47K [Firmicutes bacterium]|nr:cobalamin biosynthesis protein P47K [Bacillota bacterium]
MKIIILGGFLGSGKTTVLLQLAKYITSQPGKPQVVILENEIGEVGVDNQLLSGASFAVENIFSGCICCSGAVDLVEGVRKIAADYAPDWLLIEATGMALPSTIRQTLSQNFNFGFTTLTIADASRWTRLLKVSPDFVDEQVSCADTVILTKIDKVKGEVQPIIDDVKSHANNAELYPLCALEPIDEAIFAAVLAKVQ